MGRPKVDVEAHLKEMKECAEALGDTADKFVKGTEGIFGMAAGGGSAGMAADAESAGWGRKGDMTTRTDALDDVPDNGWGELEGFTKALGRNAANLGNFTGMMGNGLKAYGAMAITAHDTYVKTDQEHEKEFVKVDLPGKKDTEVSGDIQEHKVVGRNQPEPESPAK